jgi:hypothetical protein
MFKLVTGLIAGAASLFFIGALPATTNYQLNSYGVGSGGTANSATTNYSLEGISGEISGQTATTTNYNLKPGFIETQQANVPTITLSNPSSYYDKLKFVIGQQNNPSDAKYALQVKVNDATCDFTSGTIRYVKSDNTLGASLALSDYQTYTTWGGAGGANIIGLASSTTYCIRAKATQGQFTESAYGPSTNAATVGQQITFCLYTNANCGAGGHSASLNLLAGSVATSGNIGVDFSTNANSGGSIYIYSNGSLASTSKPGTPINSASADLSSAQKGYGAQIITASSMTKISPFDGSANNVGGLATTAQTLLNAASPVTSTGNQIQLQAKADNVTKSAPDYTDIITVIAAASF